MDNTGYCNESSTSDEDMVEIAGATLDFSTTEDVPPLDRDKGSGKAKACLCCIDFIHIVCAKTSMGIANVLFYFYYFTPEYVTLFLNPHVSPPFSSRG